MMESLRATTGLSRRRFPLRAALFLTAIDLAEKTTSFMVLMNLVTYLAGSQFYGLKKATAMTSYLGGVPAIVFSIGAAIDHFFTGRFRFSIVILSSLAYIGGLIIFAMAERNPTLRPCREDLPCDPLQKKKHAVLFFYSTCLIFVVSGIFRPSLDSLVRNEFDAHHRYLKGVWRFLFKWIDSVFGLVLAFFVDSLEWGGTNIALAVMMVVGLCLFVGGRASYRDRMPEQRPRLTNTTSVLLWAVCVVFGMCNAQTLTLFQLMDVNMDRADLPPVFFASLSLVIGKPVIFGLEKWFPISSRTTNMGRLKGMYRRVIIGMGLALVGLVIAGIVEAQRRTYKEKNGVIGFSAFFMLPPGILLAITEGILLSGISDYLGKHEPHLGWNDVLATGFYKSAVGVGCIVNGLFIEGAVRYSRWTGNSWFGKDMNSSHVDYFYWLLVAVIGPTVIVLYFVAGRIRIRDLTGRREE